MLRKHHNERHRDLPAAKLRPQRGHSAHNPTQHPGQLHFHNEQRRLRELPAETQYRSGIRQPGHRGSLPGRTDDRTSEQSPEDRGQVPEQ